MEHWSSAFDKFTCEDLLIIQQQRLTSALRHAYEHSRYYRDMFDRLGLGFGDLELPGILAELPFTQGQDLVQHSLDFRSDPVSIVYCSSGTTNRPKYIFFSQRDLDAQYERTARALVACSVNPIDFVAVAHGFGIWSIGNDFQQSLLRLGAKVLPIGKGPSDSQVISLLRNLHVTKTCTSPSFITRLIKSVLDEGLDPTYDVNLSAIILSGETISPNQRRFLESIWDAKVFSVFGCSEMGTVGSECEAQDGIHVWEDHFIVESIDPETEQAVGKNQVGELTLTALGRECTPLFRYRMGDLVQFIDSPCGCGRPYVRISMQGRVDEVIVLESGEKLWPYQVEELLKGFPEVVDYQLTVSEVLSSDSVSSDLKDWIDLALVVDNRVLFDTSLQERIALAFPQLSMELTASFGATYQLSIRVAEPSDLKRASSGKVLHFVDERSIKPSRLLGIGP